MKVPAAVLAVLTATAPLAAQAAPRVATTLPAAERTAIELLRKDVWVNWFSGDTAALRRVLGPELVAISPDSRHWQSLDETIAGSARFAGRGGKAVSITFDSTTIHRFRETVVMFSHYAVEIEHDGKRSTQAGRATEVFVKAGTRWVHTSWHLDVQS